MEEEHLKLIWILFKLLFYDFQYFYFYCKVLFPNFQKTYFLLTINNLRYADITTPMAESREELKSLLMKVNVEGEKVGLKLNIQNTMIMASGPIT